MDEKRRRKKLSRRPGGGNQKRGPLGNRVSKNACKSVSGNILIKHISILGIYPIKKILSRKKIQKNEKNGEKWRKKRQKGESFNTKKIFPHIAVNC
jgi:hypothetical protein